MRFIAFFAALFLFSVAAFTSVTAQSEIAQNTVPSAAVQQSIDKIKELGGAFTLSPENTLKTVTFTNGANLNPEFFGMLAQHTDIDSLQIANYRELSDADIAQLTPLKNLKILFLTNGGITDAAIATIAASFPDLVRLNISSNTRLTDAAMREVAKLEQLEVLLAGYCDFSEFGLMRIAKLPKLRALDIKGNMRIGNGGLKMVASMPALRSLEHRSPAVTDDGLRSLIDAKSLDNLFIQDFAITGQSGESLRQMEKLTSLFIFRCENFDSDGVLALKGLKLNRLRLRGLPIIDSTMEVLTELTTLKRLELHELPSVTDVGMANLAHLKNLEILDIWELPVTDKTMEVVAQLESMKELMLRDTKITDAGLELLLKMPNLTSVTIRDMPAISPALIKKLRDAEKFTVLTP